MCPTGSVLAAQERGRRSNLRSAFDVLDVDHDGKISRDDLQAFYGGYLAAGTSDIEDDVIGSMISVADANKDGFVEYDEFEKVLGSRNNNNNSSSSSKKQEEENGREWSLMADVFRAMDRDGDGKVGHQDLKDYLTWAGFGVNDDDVKAMIRLGGGHENGGGGVSYEGLLKILAI
ncbi:calcium-binding protein CP1 [Coffea eugenioides]|uniref:calcium-binding protein CP1 n=1 Tax=Coffea eugenioides TaxID=49369 RepID=UPI000F60CF4C|nr:calcium-binding protein CP1 [Coffea eugenioides]